MHIVSDLSVGVLGAGNVVIENHLPVLRALRGVSLKWIADGNSARARSVGKSFDIPTIDVGRIESVPAVDVLLMAIPYGARPVYYKRLGACSVAPALYIEKPLARTVAEQQAIQSKYRDYEVTCGYYRRASALLNEVAEIVSQGLFGKLREVYAGLGGIGVQGVGSGYKSNLALAGGGLLFESGVHIIDSIFFVLRATGAQVDEVSMEVDRGFDIHTDARIAIRLTDAEPIQMHLVISALVDPKPGIELHFDHAVVRFNVFGSADIQVTGHRGNSHPGFTIAASTRGPATTPYRTLGLYWWDFLAGLRTMTANYTSLTQTMLTTKLIEELYCQGGVADGSKNV